MKQFFIFLLMVLCASCSMQQNSDVNGYTTDIFVPLTSQSWHIKKETSAEKAVKRCSVYSSHNGVEVVLQKTGNNPLIQQVISSTSMEPGTYLKINVNNHFYTTYEKSFTTKISARIIEDFKQADTAYVEWALATSRSPRSFTRMTNNIKLSNFDSIYNKCLNHLNTKRASD